MVDVDPELIQPLLDQLIDIVESPRPLLWPWFVVAGVFACLIAFYYSRIRLRLKAKALLRKFPKDQHYLQRVNALLKWFIEQKSNSTEYRSLTGEQWLIFLRKTARGEKVWIDFLQSKWLYGPPIAMSKQGYQQIEKGVLSWLKSYQ